MTEEAKAQDFQGKSIQAGSLIVYYDTKKRRLRVAKVTGVAVSQLVLEHEDDQTVAVLEIPRPAYNNLFNCRYPQVALMPVQRTIMVRRRPSGQRPDYR